MTEMKRLLVAEYTRKDNNHIFITRDEYGKWYVTNGNNELTQSRLNASEIVRYLANALEGK